MLDRIRFPACWRGLDEMPGFSANGQVVESLRESRSGLISVGGKPSPPPPLSAMVAKHYRSNLGYDSTDIEVSEKCFEGAKYS